MKKPFGILLLALAVWGCSDDGSEAPEPAPAGIPYAQQIQPIFDTNCVQCHVREAPQAGLNLEDGASYAMLVGMKSAEAPMDRVKPGDPDHSYLMHKLLGTHAKVGGTGLGMPLTEGVYTPIDAKDIETIKQWIIAGAPQK